MFRKNFRMRNAIKGKICQIYDALDYAMIHPYSTLRKESHKSTVAFIQRNCPRATPCRTPIELLDISLAKAQVPGYYLEFGVFQGASITYTAENKRNETIHGFDSFEGLPESWLHNPEKAFSLGGKLPTVPSNVKLHKGYFEDTLPKWLKENKGKVAFLHVDCDLYSSTKTVMDYLGSILQKGSVILFDDYFNFPNWEEDGHRVFQEFVKKHNLKFEYLGYSYKELAVRILEINES